MSRGVLPLAPWRFQTPGAGDQRNLILLYIIYQALGEAGHQVEASDGTGIPGSSPRLLSFLNIVLRIGYHYLYGYRTLLAGDASLDFVHILEESFNHCSRRDVNT